MKPWGWKVWEDALKRLPWRMKMTMKMTWRSHEECLRMTLEEPRMIRHYEERTKHNDGDVEKMPGKGCINN